MSATDTERTTMSEGCRVCGTEDVGRMDDPHSAYCQDCKADAAEKRIAVLAEYTKLGLVGPVK